MGDIQKKLLKKWITIYDQCIQYDFKNPHDVKETIKPNYVDTTSIHKIINPKE